MNKVSAEEGNSLTVLVLDDTSMSRLLVKSILESEVGISPLVAANGEEALNILGSRPIDVVVSDFYLPGMSGIEFLRRASRLYPDTKFIMMSADAATCRTMSSECIALGALALVYKLEIVPDLVNLLRALKKST